MTLLKNNGLIMIHNTKINAIFMDIKAGYRFHCVHLLFRSYLKLAFL